MCIRLFFSLFLVSLNFVACTSSKPKVSTYTIARDPSWFPLQLEYNAIKMVGFTNALIHEIAEDQKVSFNIVDVDWFSLFQGLIEEKYPAIFSPLPLNQITDTKYTFSDPLILLGPVLVVPSSSKATSLKDLKEKIVGVSKFTDAVLIVQKFPEIIIELYDSIPTAFEDLSNGKLDAILADNLDAKALVPTQFKNQLKIVSPPLNDRGIRVLTLKNENKYLISSFNKGLAHLKASGRYQELRKEFSLD